jgi:hypothetical protein
VAREPVLRRRAHLLRVSGRKSVMLPEGRAVAGEAVLLQEKPLCGQSGPYVAGDPFYGCQGRYVAEEPLCGGRNMFVR